MATTDFPTDFVDLQKRAHSAWNAVGAYRKEVDAARRAQAVAAGLQTDPTRSWESPQLRPWTEEEDATFTDLRTAALKAGLALRAGIADAGLDGATRSRRSLHHAARET